MSHKENAELLYGRAKKEFGQLMPVHLLQMAQVEAALATVEKLDELASQVAYLSDLIEGEGKDNAARSVYEDRSVDSV